MKRANMNTRNGLAVLLTIVITLFSIDIAESSKLKQARRSIENSDELSDENKREWSSRRRRRLTMADDVFTGTGREYEVAGFHRAVGTTVIKIINKGFGGIGSLITFTQHKIRSIINSGLHSIIWVLQSIQNKVVEPEPEPEPEPATTMSAIYDSISSVISSSKESEPTPKESPSVIQQQQTLDAADTRTPSTSTSTPNSTATPVTNNDGQTTTTKAAPLLNKKNLPKATNRAVLKKKSIMEELAKGDSSSSFDSADSAVVLSREGVAAQTSQLAGLLPTLVAGFVFTSAGLIGYLWNTEWRETAYIYYEYIMGEGETESAPFHDAATASYSEDHDEILSSFDADPVTVAVPITPERF